jgi:hypothetical protein
VLRDWLLEWFNLYILMVMFYGTAAVLLGMAAIGVIRAVRRGR